MGRFPPEVVARQRGNYADVDRFRSQVWWLRRLGYQGVTLRELTAWVAGAGELPPRPVAFTFDDAYAGVYKHAAPVLEAAGWPATVFVVTGEIGGRNRWDLAKGIEPADLMSAAAIRDLARRGWEIGAHSRSHPYLSQITHARLREEVAGSRADLGELLGEAPVSWCYPFGDAGEEVVQVVRQAGFEAAVTLRRGGARRGADLLRLPRVPVGYRVGAAQLLWRVVAAGRAARAVRT